MSTYIYLECHDHDPPLVSTSEVGQHYYHLPMICDLVNNPQLREQFIADCTDLGITPQSSVFWINDQLVNNTPYRDPVLEKQHPKPQRIQAYFCAHLAQFLLQHPRCTIQIRSEYGDYLSEADIPTQLPQRIIYSSPLYQSDI